MRRALFAFVALLGCTNRERSAEPAGTQGAVTRAPELLARVRASAPEFLAFGRVSSRGIAEVTLPRKGNGEARIALDGARALTVRALDVSAVDEQSVEHAAVFAAAAPATDLLFARGDDRFEEVRVLHDARASGVARWSIAPGDGIASLRLDRGAVEALDRNGRVALRTTRLFAVDAKGVRREPALRLTRDGATWTLEATLDRAGLAYPIVLDPVWLPGASMNVDRRQPAAVRAADGKVYVGCGDTDQFEVFDPSTSSFKTLKSYGTLLSTCAMFASSDGKIRIAADVVYTYTPATDTWTTGAALDAADGGPAPNAQVVQLTDGKLLYVGGNGSPASNVATVYDPAADTWTTKATLTRGRYDHSAVLLKSGKVLVAGGFGNAPEASTEIYDPAANTWTPGPSLPAAGYKIGALTLADGKVFFAGGRGAPKATYIYDPVAGTIAIGPDLSEGRDSVSVAQTKDKRVFAFGGSFSGEGASRAVEVFPDTLATVATTLKLLQARAYAPVIELLDGRLMAIGGSVGISTATGSVELFSSFAGGAACSWDGECSSGFCASGVCCDKACKGECERCALPGKEGTCTPASAATECGAAASCTGNQLSARGRCAGTDTTCKAGATGDCAGGLICGDATSCLLACAKDADCTTNRCDTASGLCLPPIADAGVDETAPPPVAPVPEGSPKVLGAAQRCTAPSQCASGFCVDGVCCDSLCEGTCRSCALPSSPGRCTEEPVGVDLRGSCGAAETCSSTCGKGGKCTTSVAGSQCAPSTCTGTSTGKGAAVCVATGGPCGLAAQVAFDCGAYICDPAFGACRTSCSDSEACSAGFVCNVDKKVCEKATAEDDSGCAVRDGKTGGTGAAVLMGLLFALSASRGSRRRGR